MNAPRNSMNFFSQMDLFVERTIIKLIRLSNKIPIREATKRAATWFLANYLLTLCASKVASNSPSLTSSFPLLLPAFLLWPAAPRPQPPHACAAAIETIFVVVYFPPETRRIYQNSGDLLISGADHQNRYTWSHTNALLQLRC